MSTSTMDVRFLQRLSISLAYAYNTGLNGRRLEGHLYGFWCGLLCHLIGDLSPGLFLIPQLNFYYSRGYRKQYNFIPDFSIMYAPCALEDGLARLRDWHRLTMDATTRPLALIEVKRMPPRDVQEVYTFIQLLRIEMEKARSKLKDSYARISFKTHRKADRLVLIAAVGEWWSYRIVQRKDYVDVDVDNDTSTSKAQEVDDENEIQCEYGEVDRGSDEENNDDSSDEEQVLQPLLAFQQQSTSAHSSQNRYVDEVLSHPIAAKVGRHPSQGIDMSDWSGCILAGSNISDYHMSLIQNYIRNITN